MTKAAARKPHLAVGQHHGDHRHAGAAAHATAHTAHHAAAHAGPHAAAHAAVLSITVVAIVAIVSIPLIAAVSLPEACAALLAVGTKAAAAEALATLLEAAPAAAKPDNMSRSCSDVQWLCVWGHT